VEKITTIEELRKSIALLETKQKYELVLLKEQALITYESLRPVNLIKKTFSDLNVDSDFKHDILHTTLGVAAGYISKKATVGSSHNPLKQILGTLLQIGVTSLVSKNVDGITSIASSLLKSFLAKKESSPQE